MVGRCENTRSLLLSFRWLLRQPPFLAIFHCQRFQDLIAIYAVATSCCQGSTSSSECWQQWPSPPASSSLTPKQSRCAQVRKWNNHERFFKNISWKFCCIFKIGLSKRILPVEEKRGHTGSYGKQILYKTLAQVSDMMRNENVLSNTGVPLWLWCKGIQIKLLWQWILFDRQSSLQVLAR